MFEIIGMIVSAICFLVGFVMIALFIATKFEFFSKLIVDRASKNITIFSDDKVFEAFIRRLRNRRAEAKEKQNKQINK